ncbi:hypothetical protein [Flavobacterium facile]|uniref:hypothetical protein n=1 Tax=Flavobacterium facile TaxID=2893174 RepID=UPI002E77B086|nr:hypothetical protein [Flavobacterium sp. T-12]
MKTILQHIKDLPRSEWDYYYDLGQYNELQNPFLDEDFSHEDFIFRYFKRGGKVEVFNTIGSDFSNLRYPNHINSVFFLGLLVYNNTGLKEKFRLGNNAPGYQIFPFIWFLISLYHDNAYHIEKDQELIIDNNNLTQLRTNFNIEHYLFENRLCGVSISLMDSCENYFKYRIEESNVIDHGIFGGLLLYDRLLKIRRRKANAHEETLFWGEALEDQYKLAASAIATHNIWMPKKNQHELYSHYGLNDLINFTPLKFNDFNFLYLLGIIDTIDPIKTFIDDDVNEKYIFENLKMEFKKSSIVFSVVDNSKLDFQKLINKCNSYVGWLDVKVNFDHMNLEIIFR